MPRDLPPLADNLEENLITIPQLIALASQAGVDLGKGAPYNRLRYYIKIGLLPHPKKKSVDGGAPVSVYPPSIIEKLLDIDKNQKQARSIQAVKREGIKPVNPWTIAGPRIERTPEAESITEEVKEEKVLFTNEPRLATPAAKPGLFFKYAGLSLLFFLTFMATFQTLNFISPINDGKGIFLYQKENQGVSKVLGASTNKDNIIVKVIKAVLRPIGQMNVALDRLALPESTTKIDPLKLTYIDEVFTLDGTSKVVSSKDIEAKIFYGSAKHLTDIPWGEISDAPDVLSLINDVSPKDGSLQLIEGENIKIESDKENGTLTISSTAGDSVTTVKTISGSSTPVSLSSGSGISISGSHPNFTVSNSDLGSNQAIFKNIAVSSQSTITAGVNSDTLTFAAGSGISITTNAGSKTVTITNTGAGSSNADTLDTLDSTDFLRRTASSSLTSGNTLTIAVGATLSIAGTLSCTNCVGDSAVSDSITVNAAGISGTLTDAQVSDTLTIGAAGSVAAAAISGTLTDAQVSDTLTASNLVSGSSVVSDSEVDNNLTIDVTGNISATAINSGTLGNGSVTLALGSFASITGSLSDANVDDNITASNYLPLAGGTLTGSLTLNDNDGAGNDVNLIIGDANETGNIQIFNGGFIGTISVPSLGSDQAYTFPATGGTICISGGTCVASSASSVNFANITGGTNANALLISGSLGPSGSGSITATDLIAGSSVVSDAEVDNDLTISSSGSVDWASLNTFPSACGANNAVTAVGLTLTCAAFWNSSNDGAGSTLDADLLDALSSGDFLRSSASSSVTTGNTLTIDSGAILSVAGTFSCTNCVGDSAIPDTITASNYLPLTGGNLTGNLSIGNNGSFTISSGTGVFTQTYSGGTGTAATINYSPDGTAALPIGLLITPTFGINTADQVLNGIVINPDTASNGDSGDYLYSLNIANITSSSANEFGIRIGSGYDAEIEFEGSTDNGFETRLTVINPTAINVISLPNETGTVCTTGSVCSGYQASGSFVTSVTGTASRITSSGGTTPQIDIDANYVGQGSITTVGALNSGSITSDFGAIDLGSDNFTTTGSVNTGSLVLTGNISDSDSGVDVNDDLDVLGQITLGSDGTLGTDYTLYSADTTTVTSGTKATIRGLLTANPASDSSADYYGEASRATTAAYANINITGSLNGASFTAVHQGTGTSTLTNARGVATQVGNLGNGSITNAYGIYAFDANNPGGGTVVNNHGIFVTDMTAGTNDYGITIAGADTQALWLGSGEDNTDAANGIAFGLSRDTNLYRSAASILKTDDTFNINGNVNISSAGGITGVTGFTQASGSHNLSAASSVTLPAVVTQSIQDDNPTGTKNGISLTRRFQLTADSSANLNVYDANSYCQASAVTVACTGTLNTFKGTNNVNLFGTNPIINVTNMRGLDLNMAFAQLTGSGGSSTVTDYRAINITSPTTTGVTSTITSAYGLYINDFANVTYTNTPYGIYQAGTNDFNILGGSTRIGGTTSPTVALDVTGAINASLSSTFSSTSNPGFTVGDGTTGYLKIGGSTISDPNGNLTLNSDSDQVWLATGDAFVVSYGTLTSTSSTNLLDVSANIDPSSDNSADYIGIKSAPNLITPDVNLTGKVIGVQSTSNIFAITAGKTLTDLRNFEASLTTADSGIAGPDPYTITNYSGLYIKDPDLDNASGSFDTTITNSYGIYIEDFTTEGSGAFTNTPFSIYQAGLDDINYFGGEVRFDSAVVFGAQATLAVNDTTPNVSASTSFITANSSGTLINDFDAGAGTLQAGHVIFVEVNDANTDFDCTASGLNCGSTDITTIAAGDFFTWYYDGTDWHLVSFMDDSDNHNAGSGFDLAELFPSNYELEPGELVSIDSEVHVPGYVKKTSQASDKKLLGVVSTNPGITLGEPAENVSAYPIALAGRVPVKVSTENGAIEAGDPLTSSSTPGVAAKATENGPIVGKALEGFDGEGLGEIQVFVDSGWYVAPLEEGSQIENLSVTDLRVQNIHIGTNKFSLHSDGSLALIGDIKISGKVLASVLETDELVISSETSGTANILGGQNDLVIENNRVTEKSKILVTFTDDYSPALRYWTVKDIGNGFTVKLDQSVSANTKFDWVIIN